MVSLKYVAVKLRRHPYFIHHIEACGPAIRKPATKQKIKKMYFEARRHPYFIHYMKRAGMPSGSLRHK